MAMTVTMTVTPSTQQQSGEFTLKANVSGATGTPTYAWSQTSGTPTLTLTGSGNSRRGTIPTATSTSIRNGGTFGFRVSVTDSVGTVSANANLIVEPQSEWYKLSGAWVPTKRHFRLASVWESVVVPPIIDNPGTVPVPVTGLARSNLLSTSVTLSWDEVNDPTVTKRGIYEGNTLVKDIGTATSPYSWTSMTPGSVHTNVNIRRQNSLGWSDSSTNQITFTNPSTPTGFTMLMGLSRPYNADGDGGYSQWDAVRVYNFGNVNAKALAVGVKVVCLTDSGTPDAAGTADGRANAAAGLEDFLEAFYYGAAGYSFSNMSLANRKNVEIWFANSNEVNSDGSLSSIGEDNHIATTRLMYDVVHKMVGGSRRYPNASMGEDPTHSGEESGKGNYSKILNNNANYLDFIAWSMYAPGDSGDADPDNYRVYTTPGKVNPGTGDTNHRFLEVCFKRTDLVQGVRSGSLPRLKMACWEFGFPLSSRTSPGRADSPIDQSHTSWYAASIAKWLYDRAIDYNFIFHNNLWWNQDPNVFKLPADDPSTPHMADVWRNWEYYVANQDPSWANNPKANWRPPATGTPLAYPGGFGI